MVDEMDDVLQFVLRQMGTTTVPVLHDDALASGTHTLDLQTYVAKIQTCAQFWTPTSLVAQECQMEK